MTRSSLFKRKRTHTKIVGGFFSFEEQATNARLYGFGHGDHIQLRDEQGRVWRGQAEKGEDESVRYTFRDPDGRILTGVSDTLGITLRDEHGKTWRGFLD